MTDFKIEYADALTDNSDEKIHQGHVADEASNGVICNYKKFYFVIKDDSDTNVVGALTAYTAYSEIYVDDIWVDPNYRKNGLGRKLLEHLENAFKNKGYNNINLVTSQFQAPDFYKNAGLKLSLYGKTNVILS